MITFDCFPPFFFFWILGVGYRKNNKGSGINERKYDSNSFNFFPQSIDGDRFDFFKRKKFLSEQASMIIFSLLACLFLILDPFRIMVGSLWE